ncbi:MAG TPA: DUF928 domain-containing protein [Coleofasciculaceae cyanobacterium]|jgi:hypothetical protein
MKKKFLERASCSLISFHGIFSFILYESQEKAIALRALALPIATEQSNEIASTNSTGNIKDANRQQAKKPKFPDRGIPTGRRRGGTSRSDCPVLDRSLTAIVPGRDTKEVDNLPYSSSPKFPPQTKFSDSKSFLTRTLEEYPTFWIYVPQLAESSLQGEFILQDEQDIDIYRAFLNLPSKSGILNIKLPPQPSHSLKVGQKYHWYVKIFCGDKKEESGYTFVDAWIERVVITPELEEQLSTKNADRYQILIDNNIWYDAIDNLAQVQHNSTKKDRWNQLLSDLGLSDLIDRRILNIRANFQAK